MSYRLHLVTAAGTRTVLETPAQLSLGHERQLGWGFSFNCRHFAKIFRLIVSVRAANSPLLALDGTDLAPRMGTLSATAKASIGLGMAGRRFILLYAGVPIV
jgi:hypothetical protein